MRSLVQELRFAVRAVSRRWGSSLAAILCLGLGIGAATTVFSVVNAVLLRALPYEEPDRLVAIWNQFVARDLDRLSASGYEFFDCRDQASSFTGVAASISRLYTVTGGDQPESLYGARVSGNLFQLLGVRAALGRTLLPSDDSLASPRVAMISHGLWQRRYQQALTVVGQRLSLDGVPYEIVGVLPRGFNFMRGSQELYVPIAINEKAMPPRHARALALIARLKPGIAIEAAQAEMTAIARRLQTDYPNDYPADSGWGIRLVPLHEDVVGRVRAALLFVFGAVTLVLLIACVNVANLLLARAVTRRKEVALRLALGSGLPGLLRQHLAEGLLLSLAGGGLGLLLATFGVRALVAFNPARVPRLDEVGIDATVLVFSLVVAILTGVIFGLVPVFYASKKQMFDTLRQGQAAPEVRGHRRLARSALVIAETAVALLVLVGAGLLVRSLGQLQRVDLGFSTRNAVLLDVPLQAAKYPQGPRAIAFFEGALERFRAMPGVRDVAATTHIPLGPTERVEEAIVESSDTANGVNPMTSVRTVTPGYFRTLGIPLLRGRDFGPDDRLGGEMVVVVDEAAAERLWPGAAAAGGDVIGRRFKLKSPTGATGWLKVVAVVGDVRFYGPEQPAPPQVYLPLGQASAPFMTYVLQSEGDPSGLASAARVAIREVDPDQAIFRALTLSSSLADTLAWRRFYTVLLGLFAAVALTLAATGLYSVISFSVAQRTREIGIRMSLGARAATVLQLVLSQGLRLALAGLAVGLLIAFFAGRFIRSLLYGVESLDLLTFVAVSSLVLGLAALASFLPARRATKVDPVISIRSEQ